MPRSTYRPRSISFESCSGDRSLTRIANEVSPVDLVLLDLQVDAQPDRRRRVEKARPQRVPDHVGEDVLEVGPEDPNLRPAPVHLERREHAPGELLLARDLLVDLAHQARVDLHHAQLADEPRKKPLERLPPEHVPRASQHPRQLEPLARLEPLRIAELIGALGQLFERLDHRPEDRVLAVEIERDPVAAGDLLELAEVAQKAPVDPARRPSLAIARSHRVVGHQGAASRRPGPAEQALGEHRRPGVGIRRLELERVSDVRQERGVVLEDLVANERQDPRHLGEALGVLLEQLRQRRAAIAPPDPPRWHHGPEGQHQPRHQIDLQEPAIDLLPQRARAVVVEVVVAGGIEVQVELLRRRERTRLLPEQVREDVPGRQRAELGGPLQMLDRAVRQVVAQQQPESLVHLHALGDRLLVLHLQALLPVVPRAAPPLLGVGHPGRAG